MSREKANNRVNSRTSSVSTKASRGKPKLIIGLAIVICLIGIIVYLLVNNGDSEPDSNIVITSENVEEAIKDVEKSEFIAPGSYEATMNYKWTFDDGSSASKDAYVENCVRNKYTVYFTVALATAPDKEIYHSPYLAVGSHIEKIKLDKDLDKGVYDAVLTYHLVDDKNKDVSKVSVSVTLTISK